MLAHDLTSTSKQLPFCKKLRQDGSMCKRYALLPSLDFLWLQASHQGDNFYEMRCKWHLRMPAHPFLLKAKNKS
jgi:hypothetical protein